MEMKYQFADFHFTRPWWLATLWIFIGSLNTTLAQRLQLHLRQGSQLAFLFPLSNLPPSQADSSELHATSNSNKLSMGLLAMIFAFGGCLIAVVGVNLYRGVIGVWPALFKINGDEEMERNAQQRLMFETPEWLDPLPLYTDEHLPTYESLL
ncbi:hypothetical protein K7432_012945 [Basidiobolus ranarum]|uniref:Uncharacterized protein n=1 Tax=Basidiobolus ranarum TaxID=34480 RepID=A0ABR2WJZ9_9FUNG